MLLRNLLSVESNQLVDIDISGDKIAQISATETESIIDVDSFQLTFENAIVFPGLINSHDHLDFNSFPQLGNKKYNNYVEWGNDIHNKNKTEINKVLKVPKHLRVEWGMYKNLLNGITTVVNHGPKLLTETDIISVFQQCQSLHSIQLEKNWILKLNKPNRKKLPVVVHIGEGTDIKAHYEINKLLRWNIMQKKLIGVHAIAMNEKQAKNFKAIVWCPASNQFLIGKTADINLLKNHSKILFGTDSTVSSDWNLWNHLALGRISSMLSDKELYETLTKNAAEVWNFKSNGELKPNNFADVIIARQNKKGNALHTFFSLQPEDILLSIYKGKISLFDESIYHNLQKHRFDFKEYYRINLNGSFKYIKGNLPALIKQIKDYYPEAQFPVN